MVYEYGAAKASIRRKGVIEVSYTGPLDLAASMALALQTNRVVKNEAKLVRVDQALLCFSRQAPLDEIRAMGEGKFGVIVCRPDQFQITRDFCDRLALLGVVRVAFLCPVAAHALASSFAALTQ